MKRFLLLLFVCVSCLDPYYPPASADSLNALVVDGYIDINGTAFIKLARSLPLNGYGNMPYEANAIVSIETSDGEKITLQEQKDATYADKNGIYKASGLSVNYNSTYQLHIKTSNGKEYHSTPVRIYPTPEIDSVYFTIAGSQAAVEVRIDAHDTNPNATGYYAVDGDETYEYHATVISNYKLVNHVAVTRLPEDQVYYCWRDVIAPPVALTTHRLSENVVTGSVIRTINKDDVKIKVRYSDLVKLRAISEEEYIYLNELIKSTEQQGSLWSVIPGPVPGNVQNIEDPNEYVLGYFGGQEKKERRFFLDRGELPPNFSLLTRIEGCQPESTCLFVEDGTSPVNCIQLADLGKDKVIVSIATDGNGTPLYYNYVQPQCGDCRTLGGYTTKPFFW